MTDPLDTLIGKLEAGLQDRDVRVMIRHHGDTIMLASIAISMKRIADGVDHICNYGISKNEP